MRQQYANLIKQLFPKPTYLRASGGPRGEDRDARARGPGCPPLRLPGLYRRGRAGRHRAGHAARRRAPCAAKGCRERPGGLRRRFAVFHARRGRGAFVAAGRHARAGVQREGLLIRVETLKPLSCEAGEGLKQMASGRDVTLQLVRSEEHTSELQSLMRISYAVFCLKKKIQTQIHDTYSL